MHQEQTDDVKMNPRQLVLGHRVVFTYYGRLDQNFVFYNIRLGHQHMGG